MGARDRLSARSVATCVHPGGTANAHRLSDGGGLYLQITATGTKSWLFRFTKHGRPTLLGLGPYGERDGVSLSKARGLAADARALLAAGGDPKEAKQAAERAAKAAAADVGDRTFKATAERMLKQRAPGWRNAKHVWQWRQTLERHAYPVLGSMAVADIAPNNVMQVLKPIWGAMPETAQRLRGRIEAVLDFAKVDGLRSGDNPARWRGHLALLLPSPTKGSAKRGHHAALPWTELPGFLTALRAADGTAARALEFLILTAARTGEVIGARWREVDLDAAVWTAPAERMKAGREHRVPLSSAALVILRGQLPLARGPETAIFQSGAKGSGTGPLSNMAMLSLLRRLNPADDAGMRRWVDNRTGAAITAHGFRSAFRDWVGETTDYPTDVAEAALAHVNRDKTEASYARGDLFTKRTRMMNEWAVFCSSTGASVSINLE